MKTKPISFSRRLVAGVMFFLFTRNELFANPTGLTVTSGTASAHSSGSRLTITAGNNAVLNWQSFDIAAGEKTVFIQPSSTSIVWNRIGNQSASQIYGSLQANGVVVLLNSSGFYFGPNSFVSAAGLVVSTANYMPPQYAAGIWEFNGPPPLASIVNYGQIKIGHGGDCFLIADQIENHGSVEARGGTIGLAAGQTVTLSERADGRGMSMKVLLPQGSVDNVGNLIADGGTIALNAKVVNQNGFIQANSVKNQNGVIELIADDSLTLGANSQILAGGDNSDGGSAGGSVTLKSGNDFSDVSGSQISTSGGVNGGNGGNLEISAPDILSLNSTMKATAQNGFTGGDFLLDPVNIILGTSTAGGAINVNSAFAGFSTILLQASGNITVNANTSWNLSSSTGVAAGQLTLQAGGNITFNNGSKILDAKNWSVSLAAGYDYVNNVISSTTGNIAFSGNSSIQTATGNIGLLAGGNISIASGYVRTSGGGNVSAQAVAGSINTGTYAHGYTFTKNTSLHSTYYQVDLANGTGGISTEAGGNVSLIAGQNVTSFLPSGNAANSIGGDAGSGAFGPQAGNVTVVAGGNVVGHYVAANGTGKIVAGAQLDANGNPVTAADGNYVLNPNSGGDAGTANTKLALSLIAGGWTVNAAQDINLQEVRNPNGVFNNTSSAVTPPTYHYFNYAPDAYVNLAAGNAVVLGDSSGALPRADSDGIEVPFIYAPILNIVAGAGGVTLTGDTDPYGKLILFPSPQGSLTISTTGGGSLTSALPNNSDGSPAIFDLIVSDSGQNQYSDPSAGVFGVNDHAATPIHLNNPTPITLNISGDMDNTLLSVPEAAQINVVGDMNNSRFDGMNLNAADVTSINVGQVAKQNMEANGVLNPQTDGNITVGGDIANRSDFTTALANTPPNLAYLTQAYPPNPLAANLAKELSYNPATKQLTFQGAVTSQVLALLQNLQIQVYDKKGVPQFDADGNPILKTVSIIDPATATALQNQYAALGPIPTTLDSGYIIGGGGQFVVNAKNLDLGTTLGIQSQGVGYDAANSPDNQGNQVTSYPLAKLFTTGANITVNTSGDLDLFSTAIASLNGGNVYVNAGGTINVGSPDFSVNTTTARGIYATSAGNVAVYAGGDIDVNGSRIAAYDVRPPGTTGTAPGGSVTVVSRNGSINAGSGGSGFVIVNAYLVDPTTHNVTSVAPTIPGTGILDTSYTEAGNILAEAPNGSVNAGSGGIVQLLLNHPVADDTTLFGLPLNLDTLSQIFRLAFKGQIKPALTLQNKLNGNLGNSQVSVYAGYELQKLDSLGNPQVDTYGNPVINANNSADGTLTKVSSDQDINALSSGLISAGSLNVEASGDANVNFFALNDVNINANANINAAGLGLGVVSVNSASGTVSGTIAGIGGVVASGSSVEANLESNGSVTGDTSGQKGLAQGTAADAIASSAAASSDANKTTDKSSTDDTDDDLKKKKGKGISLAQKVSRVTVLLPKKD